MLASGIYCLGGAHGQHNAEKSSTQKHQEGSGRGSEEKNNCAPSQVGAYGPRETRCEGRQAEAQDLGVRRYRFSANSRTAPFSLSLPTVTGITDQTARRESHWA